MADAEVNVFAPGQPNEAAVTGRTDKDGKFEFRDRPSMASGPPRPAMQQRDRARLGAGRRWRRQGEPVSPYWLIGGLFVLLVLAFGYRIARARMRRRR